MTKAPSDLVVTGMGAETCLGSGVAALWDGLSAGRSGLALDPEMEAMGLRCRVSGRLPGVDRAFAEGAPLTSQEKAYFSRFSRIGYLAALEALRDAGISGRATSGRAGVLVGSGIGAISELEHQFKSSFARVRPRSPGHAVPLVMPSFLPSFLAQALGATSGGATVSIACNSGLLALEQAASAIRSGRADWFLVGGVEEDSPFTWWSFDMMRALGRTPASCPEPALESRPFGAGARGFIPAGAGAFLVIESREHAVQRGARVRASLRACVHRAGGSPGKSLTAFNKGAYKAAVNVALSAAGIEPEDLDVLVPHASSTSADVDELAALDEVMGIERCGARIYAPKSLIGHSIGASGLVDLIALISQLERGYALASAVLLDLAEGAQPFAPALTRAAGPALLRRGLKTGHAFGSSDAAVIVEGP